jgi:hypothetical protein
VRILQIIYTDDAGYWNIKLSVQLIVGLEAIDLAMKRQ